MRARYYTRETLRPFRRAQNFAREARDEVPPCLYRPVGLNRLESQTRTAARRRTSAMEEEAALRDTIKRALDGKGVLAQIRVRYAEMISTLLGTAWLATPLLDLWFDLSSRSMSLLCRQDLTGVSQAQQVDHVLYEKIQSVRARAASHDSSLDAALDPHVLPSVHTPATISVALPFDFALLARRNQSDALGTRVSTSFHVS